MRWLFGRKKAAQARAPKRSDPPAVSVITPVYQAEACIERCLASLRAQTLTDLEMIFIDDCGKDRSLQILAAAAEKDPRIRILKNERNLGPGPSRNLGLWAARGEYIAFLDADDYYAPDFLERLYRLSKAEGLEVAKGRCVSVTAEGEVLSKEDPLNRNLREGLAQKKPIFLFFRDNVWSALYLRKALAERGVRFGSAKKGEDVCFLLRLLKKEPKFGLCEDACYHYVQTKDSLTHRRGADILEQQFKGLKEQIEVLEEYEADQHVLRTIYEQIRYNLMLQDEYVREGNDSEANAHFLASLRELVRQMKHADIMAQKYTVLRALRDYGENIRPSVLPSRWKEGDSTQSLHVILLWSRFFMRHPECAEDKDYQKSMKIVMDYHGKAHQLRVNVHGPSDQSL